MKSVNKPAVNAGTYKKYGASLIQAFEKELRTSANPKLLFGTARRIGNLYGEFADVDAKEWYLKAIELLRGISRDPSVTLAYLLWRVGDRAILEKECKDIVDLQEQRLDGLRAELRGTSRPSVEHDDARRRLASAYQEAAVASLYLGRSEDVGRWVGRAMQDGVGWDYFEAVGQVGEALAARNQRGFERALERIRAFCEPWPTFESSSVLDTYRLCLALGREHFGSIPQHLEVELLRPFTGGLNPQSA